MNNKLAIDILLATYNGQAYLKELIDSVLAQSCQDWQLLIRDDGSIDDTVNIIEGYQRQYPDKIKIITGNVEHLGANLNFGRLLKYAEADYIMFCDQDDVWLPQKIEVMLNAMKAAEKDYPDKPIMAHCDLVVVNANLEKVADSLWYYQKILPREDDDLNRIILQNVATGCATMINREAKKVSLPIPKDAIMHDWWIAIKVAEHGKIVNVPDKLVLYRQHPNNLVGAKKTPKKPKWNIQAYFGRLFSLRQRILNHYRMVKSYDPNATFWSVVSKKIASKIAQKYR